MTDYAPLIAALAEEQTITRLDARHCYWRGKQRAPGVTTIIRVKDAPQLDAWKVRVQVDGTARAAHSNPPGFGETVEAYTARLQAIAAEQMEHERLSDEAAKIGTDVHALIEHACRKMLGEDTFEPAASDEAWFRFAGWEEWAENVRLQPLAVESRVYHREFDYCGTLDLLAMVNDRPAVIDWKASSGVYDSHRLQSAAYRGALKSMGWPETDGYIVHVPKDGGEITMDQLEGGEDFDAAFEAFRCCLQLYRWDATKRREYAAKKKAAA